MEAAPLTKVDINQLSQQITTLYANFSVALVNDHTVKLSVMTQPYDWHYHPNSDETFLTVEGTLVIDLETETIELSPGQLFTVPANLVHRTQPKEDRSVNLTVEHQQTETIVVER